MIALDTNVLVRYIVQDDPKQSKTASELIEGFQKAKQTCLITDIVLCEMVWVLESCYDASRRSISEVLEKILKIDIFNFISKDLLYQCVNRYQDGSGDFADYLLGLTALHEGASKVYTFDKSLKREDPFLVIS